MLMVVRAPYSNEQLPRSTPRRSLLLEVSIGHARRAQVRIKCAPRSLAVFRISFAGSVLVL